MTPRTVTDMIRELYDVAKNHEWIKYQSIYGWDSSKSYLKCNYCNGSREKGHEDKCYLSELFQEVKGFLLVENDLCRGSK